MKFTINPFKMYNFGFSLRSIWIQQKNSNVKRVPWPPQGVSGFVDLDLGKLVVEQLYVEFSDVQVNKYILDFSRFSHFSLITYLQYHLCKKKLGES